MIVVLAMNTMERLNHIYVCRWCGKAFLFRKDKAVHKEQHEHKEFAIRTLDEKLLNPA
jgi:hypothetical protein